MFIFQSYKWIYLKLESIYHRNIFSVLMIKNQEQKLVAFKPTPAKPVYYFKTSLEIPNHHLQVNELKLHSV